MLVEQEQENGVDDPAVLVHRLRKDIDGVILAAEQLQDMGSRVEVIGKGARELALVRTKLQEAKMWGGKVLEAMGTPFPAELRDHHEDREAGSDSAATV